MKCPCPEHPYSYEWAGQVRSQRQTSVKTVIRTHELVFDRGIGAIYDLQTGKVSLLD